MIEPLEVPQYKHELRDQMTLYRAIEKINVVIDYLNRNGMPKREGEKGAPNVRTTKPKVKGEGTADKKESA